MNLTEFKNNYDNFLSLNYTSKQTISAYKNCYLKFIKENSRIYRMSKKEIFSYLESFKKAYSIPYYNQMVSSIKIIYKLLGQTQKVKSICYLKPSKKEIDILTKEEIIKGLKNIDNTKHQLIVKLLYVGALRISELINLKLTDIDRGNKRLIIRTTKGGKGRFVPLDNNIIQEIITYYRKYKPNIYLFEGNSKSGKYSPTSVRNVVKKLKCKKKVYPHIFRHSGLTRLVDEGHNLLKVQKYAGHESSSSTERYYHLSNKSLENMTLSL